MAKKRSHDAVSKDVPVDTKDTKMKDGDSDDEDFDTVNVDFEWFNFDSNIDFHGTKSLLRQLFDVDATLQDISALADHILNQPTIGSTVKVDGKATDAYALCTVLNLKELTGKAGADKLLAYLTEKASLASPALAAEIEKAMAEGTVGLVFSERLINMPAEIAPPLYRMLLEEVEAAVEDKEPYAFTHYLVLSKVYTEVESTLVETERKAKRAREDAGTFYFHAEDEVLQKHAVAWGCFDYTNEDEVAADSKRAFQEMGIKTRGELILIGAQDMPKAVAAVEAYVSAGQS